MGYSFMTIEKIKTTAQMRGKYKHNFRVIDVPNADATRSHLNEELVHTDGETYEEKYESRMKKFGYGLKEADFKEQPELKKVRSNAVLGFELVLTFSREDRDRIDVEQWKKDNVKWLEKTFNPSEEFKEKNGSNVLSVVYHGDEAGNVHLHAFVLPIDERGRLNAQYYVKNRAKMIAMQDSYGKEMKERHNLDRGIKGSHARHEDIKRYYAALNMNLEKVLPPPFLDETVAAYRERANEVYTNLSLKTMGLEQKVNRLSLEKEQIEKNAAAEVKKKVAEKYRDDFEIVRTCEERFGDMQETMRAAESFFDILEGIGGLNENEQLETERLMKNLMEDGSRRRKLNRENKITYEDELER